MSHLLAVIVTVGAVACARPQVGIGPTLGTGRLATSAGGGAGIEAGGWLRGERVGVFAVAELAGYPAGNDADIPRWLGLDVRGRIVLHRQGTLRVPFVFGGGAGFEVGYVAEPFASGLGELGVEMDAGTWVLGLRARERLGVYIGDGSPALSWQSSTSAILDVGRAF
ncbi:MAG: hypothetical protein SFX73_06110 [Kofleriaceae bacterium]|nr:hypothetical protein [Kofleriaceae bacterium]